MFGAASRTKKKLKKKAPLIEHRGRSPKMAAGAPGKTTSCVVLALLVVIKSSCGHFRGIVGDYCANRISQRCCPVRDDLCSVPLFGTLCYCDQFCATSEDCCPDFRNVCFGTPKPTPLPRCYRNGTVYNLGESFKENCHKCTCISNISGFIKVHCKDDTPCLVRPDLIQIINHGNHGWTASNYSFLWGKTLDEGIKQRLGTFRPTKQTLDMGEIHFPDLESLPTEFDSRLRWSTWIQPVRDQGDCAASWAFSSTALVSDRLAVMTGGLLKVELSPQMLISCQSRGQRGCSGGHTDRALVYLRKHGVSGERCYPYYSGYTSKVRQCEVKRVKPIHPKNPPEVRCIHNGLDNIYHSTPAYRISNKEDVIMQEIMKNGPVQAVFQVKEDFYVYKSGIYYHTRSSEHLPRSYRRTGWHSVRIIGWGVDHSRRLPVKYWLCANSWGPQWGENGYFRILRGSNECDIETFVVGVWGNQEDPNSKYVIDYGRIRPFG